MSKNFYILSTLQDGINMGDVIRAGIFKINVIRLLPLRNIINFLRN